MYVVNDFWREWQIIQPGKDRTVHKMCWGNITFTLRGMRLDLCIILFINVNSKNWKYITLSLSPHYYNHCSWFWPWCSFRIYRILAKFLVAGEGADSVLWEQETVWTWPWLCWAGDLPLYQLPLRPTNKTTSILSPRASGTFPLS